MWKEPVRNSSTGTRLERQVCRRGRLRRCGLRLRRPLQQAADGFRGLGAHAQPVSDTLLVECDLGRLATRVVESDDFYKTTVAGLLLFNHHDPVTDFFFGSSPG